MSTQKAEMIDVHEWEAEESNGDRKTKRDLMVTKVERSAEQNEGNKVYVRGMLKTRATDTKKHKCAGAYVWYSVRQDPQTDDKFYGPGEQSEWEDRAPNWQKIMTTAIGDSGAVERRKMKKLIGEDLKTLHPSIVKACEEDLEAFEKEEVAKSTSKRPKMRIKSYTIGLCEVQLGDDEAYNDHMKNLHGVTTQVSSKKLKSNIYPDLDTMSGGGGVEKVLTELGPTLKVISHTNGNHVPISKLQAQPGKKEVEMGIEDLKINLISDGRLIPGAKKTHLDHYGHVTQRMLELVHENDQPQMKRTYAQLSKHRWERGHEIHIDIMEKAIRDIINKNSAEIAMKRFDDFRFSEKRGLSSQLVDASNMVEEFFGEEQQITAYEKSQEGEEEPLLNHPVFSKVLKDAFCIFKIITKAPEYENSGYKGLIRKLLQPALENISMFDLDSICEALKEWESSWDMFKAKPAVKGDKEAAANLAKGGPKRDFSNFPPIDKKRVEQLKQTVAEANFTTASFREHSKDVDLVTRGKSGGRLCYWCVEPECLATRTKQWYSKHPSDPKSSSYREWRSKVDRETSKDCTEYAKIDKRKKQGAVIYCITVPEERANSSRENSMTSNESSRPIPQISLHCYRTCKNYTECCPIPDKCRQLRNEAKMCPIRQLRKEHGCGYMDILPENELDEINQHRELKLERYGMTEDGLKVREPRDYTPDEAFEVLYAVETSRNSVYTDDEWREEDDSRYFREGGFGVEEVEKPETEVEEYVMEDPYDEVKRFSDLTEDEVDTVLQKLKEVSTKYATIFRPEIRGGEEDRRFLKELEKLVTSIDLIFLVMPLTEEFKRRKEMEQGDQSHHSANPSVRAISEVDERRQIQCSEVGSDQENFKKQVKRTKKVFHTSTDNSAAEDNIQKKQPKKQSANLDSSTEEEEMELTSPVKKRSNNKTPMTPNKYEEMKSADTRLVNGLFQRASDKDSLDSEKKQTEVSHLKYWVGPENFPLVDHKQNQDKKNWGPRRCQEKLSWLTGITTAIWLLWVAIFTGIYPIYQTESSKDQTAEQEKKETQTKGQGIAEQPELQVSNQKYKRRSDNLLERQGSRNPDEDSDMQ